MLGEMGHNKIEYGASIQADTHGVSSSNQEIELNFNSNSTPTLI